MFGFIEGTQYPHLVTASSRAETFRLLFRARSGMTRPLVRCNGFTCFFGFFMQSNNLGLPFEI